MENSEICFRNLIDNLSQHDVSDEFKFIGTGNPLAKILIIGKEVAIDKDKNPDVYKKEILNNFNDWNNLVDFNLDTIKDKDWYNYSPLYPYKGQEFKIINKENNNAGTSRTWYNYQKILKFITEGTDNKFIDFHKNIFITEVNSSPSLKTADANRDSIKFRKEHLLSSDFFQNFPIVIISGIGYFNIIDGNNEIENIFDVEFKEQKFANFSSQPYWIHFNKDRTKIVINTHQLSIGISDKLLKDIANEIKEPNLF